MSRQEIEVFFLYAHEDEELRNKLAKHLMALQRQEIIKQWHDREIRGGEEWASEIDRHLNSAHIILLLLSSDFMDSDCYDKAVSIAIRRHRAREAKVISIILRQVDLYGTPFRELILPKNQVAVTSWLNQDEAFTDIAMEIRNIIIPSEDSNPDNVSKKSHGLVDSEHIKLAAILQDIRANLITAKSIKA